MGGAETLVKEYALHMKQDKFEVVILCYEHTGSPYEKQLEAAGIRIIYAGEPWEKWKKRGLIGKIVRHYGLFFSIRKYLRKETPDVIHAHLHVNKYVRFAKVSHDTMLVYTVHTEPKLLWDRKIWRRRIDFQAAKWLVRHYNMRLIVLHDDMRKEVNELFGVDNSIVVNNGIDLARFQQKCDKNEMRRKFQIPEDNFVIGHVGRFSEVKNHRFLLEIFGEIAKQMENAFLLLVGDGEERGFVEAELKRRNLGDKYKILSNRSDVDELMSAMDVFVFPSLFEGLPVVLIEAQAKGLPCVVSDRVPAAAAISNLVEVHSLEASAGEWADTICKKNRAVQPVYDRLEEWDMKNITKKLERIYRKEI
jgi:glycosyltransferase involved in cell wall biosynthesis